MNVSLVVSTAPMGASASPTQAEDVKLSNPSGLHSLFTRTKHKATCLLSKLFPRAQHVLSKLA